MNNQYMTPSLGGIVPRPSMSQLRTRQIYSTINWKVLLWNIHFYPAASIIWMRQGFQCSKSLAKVLHLKDKNKSQAWNEQKYYCCVCRECIRRLCAPIIYISKEAYDPTTKEMKTSWTTIYSYRCSYNRWTNEGIFLEWLDHCSIHVKIIEDDSFDW